MSRPTDDPQWATGATYGAGPYAGNANKNRPPAGNITEGFDPQSGLPASWLNYWFNNHGSWLKSTDSTLLGTNFYLKEDFTQSALTTDWVNATTGTTTTTMTPDDSVNGGWGAVEIEANATGTNTIKTDAVLPVGTGDFLLTGRFRLPSAIGSDQEFALFITQGAGATVKIGAFGAGSTTKFSYLVDSGSATALSPSIDTAYHWFSIQRLNGVLTLFIDGAQVFTGAYTTNLASCRVGVESVAGVSASITGYVDAIKFWANR